jgi:hypothetical protein
MIARTIGLIASAAAIRADLRSTDDIILPGSLFVVPAAVAFTAVGTAIGAGVGVLRWTTPPTPATP